MAHEFTNSYSRHSCAFVDLCRLGFLGFFVVGMLPAPLAEFFQLNFTLHQAEVFTNPVIVALAGGALQADKVGLRHRS